MLVNSIEEIIVICTDETKNILELVANCDGKNINSFYSVYNTNKSIHHDSHEMLFKYLSNFEQVHFSGLQSAMNQVRCRAGEQQINGHTS